MTTQPGSRRSFMRYLGIGSAAAVGAVALPSVLQAPAAGAQGASTTKPAPLPAGDVTTIQGLEGMELAAQQALTAAVGRRVLNASETELVRMFAAHHYEHGLALAKAAGRTAQTIGQASQQVLASVTGPIQGAATAQALVTVLYQFEERLAATHQVALATIATPAAAGVVGQCLAVDAQQAATLGQDLSLPLADWLPAQQPTIGAFEPTVLGA